MIDDLIMFKQSDRICVCVCVSYSLPQYVMNLLSQLFYQPIDRRKADIQEDLHLKNGGNKILISPICKFGIETKTSLMRN